MADSDNTLKLLIQLGIIGQEDAKAARDLLVETKAAAEDMTQSMPENMAQMKKAGEAIEGAAGSSEKFALHGEGMRKVIGQLNRVAPGLGEAFHGIEKAVTQGGGALIVVSLAIEAAMTYWEMYKESVAESAAAQAAALDKTRIATHNLIEEQAKFKTALDNNKPAAADYIKDLGDQVKVLEAQFTVRKNILEIAEKAELANAKTPEEQQAIKARYEVGKGNLAQSEDARKIEAIANERIALENQKLAVENEKTSLDNRVADLARRKRIGDGISIGPGTSEEERKTITHMGGGITQSEYDKGMGDAAPKMAELTKTLEDLNRQASELKGRYTLDSRIGNINADGRALANKLNERDKQTGQTLAEMGTAAHLNQSQIIEIARQLLSGQMTHALEIAGLKALMRNAGLNGK